MNYASVKLMNKLSKARLVPLYVMKAYGRVESVCHRFLTFALDGEQSASCPKPVGKDVIAPTKHVIDYQTNNLDTTV
jgi:hypothetical protein